MSDAEPLTEDYLRKAVVFSQLLEPPGNEIVLALAKECIKVRAREREVLGLLDWARSRTIALDMSGMLAKHHVLEMLDGLRKAIGAEGT